MATLDELEQKYLTGGELCKEVARLQGNNDRILLSFSMGKDCLAAWVGIRNHFKEVIPFFLYMVPDIEFIDEALEYYEKVLGTRIIRLPSPSLYSQMRDNMFQPPERVELIHACQWPKFNYNDIHRVICEDNDLPIDTFYATGVRAPDSPMRMTAISKYGPITHSGTKFHAVWNWRKARLVQELRDANIKLPVDYLLFSRSWDGMDLRFMWKIKQHFPRDFRRILDWFPLVELEISRYEFHLRKKTVDDLRQGGATEQQISTQIQLMKQDFHYEGQPHG